MDADIKALDNIETLALFSCFGSRSNIARHLDLLLSETGKAIDSKSRRTFLALCDRESYKNLGQCSFTTTIEEEITIAKMKDPVDEDKISMLGELALKWKRKDFQVLKALDLIKLSFLQKEMSVERDIFFSVIGVLCYHRGY